MEKKKIAVHCEKIKISVPQFDASYLYDSGLSGVYISYELARLIRNLTDVKGFNGEIMVVDLLTELDDWEIHDCISSLLSLKRTSFSPEPFCSVLKFLVEKQLDGREGILDIKNENLFYFYDGLSVIALRWDKCWDTHIYPHYVPKRSEGTRIFLLL
jgi:hypothetical protein